MAVNAFFKTNNLASIQAERNLYSDLIKEAIQIYGHDVYYVDRTTVAIDSVLGEDSLSKFTTQHPIEMYIEDGSGGYQGEKEIIRSSKSKAKVVSVETKKLTSGKILKIITLQETDDLTETIVRESDKKFSELSRKYLK